MEPRPPSDQTVISIPTVHDAIPPLPQLPAQLEGEGEERGRGRGEEGEEVDSAEETPKFISSEELAQNRLSEGGKPPPPPSFRLACHPLPLSEMKEVSVFRGYSAGEPSLRLYIKNLAKYTSEQVYHVHSLSAMCDTVQWFSHSDTTSGPEICVWSLHRLEG